MVVQCKSDVALITIYHLNSCEICYAYKAIHCCTLFYVMYVLKRWISHINYNVACVEEEGIVHTPRPKE